MVVQHNLQAQNASRMLKGVTSAQSKSTKRLSSGYRINSAADDAAGLAISEEMRSQIRGLNKASANAQDGISLIQVAEGSLNEVHAILHRMNELAIQAANDTNTTMDRSQIKKEIDQLVSEIDRTASTTQFNTMNLLDGTFQNKNLQVGALAGQNIEINIRAMDAHAFGLNMDFFDPLIDDVLQRVSSIELIGQNDKTQTAYGVASIQVGIGTGPGTWEKAIYNGEQNLLVSSYEMASRTLKIVQNAVDLVSQMRSSLGAVQNRLEHTIANLDSTSENTSAAESRIRDTDMAEEMVSYSKNNILAQAGQSILAQANQSPQGILSILQ